MEKEIGSAGDDTITVLRDNITGALNRKEHDEEAWGQKLAKEQEEAYQEIARQGLRLSHVVPVQTSIQPVTLQGSASWTAGVWLYFSRIEQR